MPAKRIGEQLPNLMKKEQTKEIVDTITKPKAKQTFIYEVFVKGETSPRRVNCKDQCACNGTVFMFPKDNGNELLLVVNNVISIELVEAPKGDSNIIGLDGKPADAPRTLGTKIATA